MQTEFTVSYLDPDLDKQQGEYGILVVGRGDQLETKLVIQQLSGRPAELLALAMACEQAASHCIGQVLRMFAWKGAEDETDGASETGRNNPASA